MADSFQNMAFGKGSRLTPSSMIDFIFLNEWWKIVGSASEGTNPVKTIQNGNKIYRKKGLATNYRFLQGTR